MKFQWKRIVSTVCALALCTSIFPVSALAGGKGAAENVGTPVTIEVYLDGQHQAIQNVNDFVTIDTADTTSEPKVTIDGNGDYHYEYKYEQYNCADLTYHVNDQYVLQAIDTILVYGQSGSKGISKNKIDNVQGGSTVRFYLGTKYRVKYVVDEKDSTEYTDDTDYSVISPAVADLESKDQVPNDDKKFDADLQGNGMQQGYQVTEKFNVEDTIQLKSIDTSKMKGWYKEADYQTLAEKELRLADVLASEYAVSSNVISFFGRTLSPDVQVTKKITQVVRDATFTLDQENIPDPLQVGDQVTYQVTVTNAGDVTLNGLTVTDTFTGSSQPTGGLTWNGNKGEAEIESLEVGESQVYEYTYTVADGDEGGKISNQAVAVSDEDDSVTDEDSTETEVGTVNVSKEPVTDTTTTTMKDRDGKEIQVSHDKISAEGKSVYTSASTARLLYKVTVSGFAGAVVTVKDTPDVVYNGVSCSASCVGYGKGVSQFVPGTENETITMSGNTAELYYLVTVSGLPSIDEGAQDVQITVNNSVTANGKSHSSDPVIITVTNMKVRVQKSVKHENVDVSNGTVKVGDELTYTIDVTNTGEVALEEPVLNDYFDAAGYLDLEKGISVKILDTQGGEADSSVTFQSWNGHNGQWILNDTLPVGYTARFTYTYKVQKEDAGKTLTNTAVVDKTHLDEGSSTTTKTDVEDPAIEVIKDSSVAGTNDSEAGMLVAYTVRVTNKGNVPLTSVAAKDTMAGKIQEDSLTVTLDGKTVPFTFDKAAGSITITGQSLAVGKTFEIQYTCAVVDQDLKDNKITNTVTVTARTENGGEATDEDTEETTVYAGTLTLTPAPIVIYTGGTSGQAIVDENGSIITNDTLGLPVLGFLFKDSDGTAIGVKDYKNLTLYDISGLRGGQYSWTATPYNENSTVLYQLEPSGDNADGKQNVRIQLLDQETNQVWDTDAFQIGDYLYKQYTTEICTELGNGNAQVVAKVGNSYYKVTSATSTLTVRGTTGDAKTNPVAPAPEKLNNAITTPQAVIDPSASYYYVSDNRVTTNEDNAGDKLKVEDTNSVLLLVDEIVDQAVETDQQYVQMMKNKVEQDASLLGAVPADTARVWRFYYMDLVLANNGNAVLTTDKDVTIYWPYPDGITYQDAVSGKYDFTILHYTGLERNYKSETFAQALDACKVAKYEITFTEQGLKFTVPTEDGFSPFALVYEYSTKTPVTPTVTPAPSTQPNQTVTATGSSNSGDNTAQPTPTPTPAAAVVIPQTGDDMPLFALVGAAAVAAVALVTLVVLRRRRRNP